MTYLLVALGFALCVLAYAIDKSSLSKDSFPVLAGFCFVVFYSTCGQVLVFLNGYEIYSGVQLDAINDSVRICLTALSALVLSFLIAAMSLNRTAPTTSVAVARNHSTAMISAVVLACITAALAAFGLKNIGVVMLPKDMKLAQVGTMHYSLLLVWQIAYVVHLANEWKVTRTTTLCLLVFAAYCIMMSERDFVFAATAFGLLAIKKLPKLKNLSTSFITLLAASAVSLSAGRGGNFDDSLFISALSQGSNLFVNSYVYNYIAASGDYFHGKSYWDAVLSTLSFGLIKGEYALSDWLTRMYAGPNSTSGYGFSLEGEAYLNFGFTGVFVVFFCIGQLISYGVKKGDTGSMLPKLVYIWTVVFLFYQVRQESLVVLKTLWLCLFVAAVIKMVSRPSQRYAH